MLSTHMTWDINHVIMIQNGHMPTYQRGICIPKSNQSGWSFLGIGCTALNYIDHHRPCVGQQWPNSKCHAQSHQTCEENPTCILLSCCSCFVSFQERVGFLLSRPRGFFAGLFFLQSGNHCVANSEYTK